VCVCVRNFYVILQYYNYADCEIILLRFEFEKNVQCDNIMMFTTSECACTSLVHSITCACMEG
jgi:hypothetical protein